MSFRRLVFPSLASCFSLSCLNAKQTQKAIAGIGGDDRATKRAKPREKSIITLHYAAVSRLNSDMRRSLTNFGLEWRTGLKLHL